MDEMLSSLPWIITAVALGVMISFADKLLPQIYLAKLGTVPYLSANWITSWSIFIWYAGFVIYALGFVMPALVIMVVAGAFDKLDGHVARAKESCGFPRSIESVKLGAWWDPLADKIRQLPLIGFMMCAGLFTPYVVIPVIAVDIMGTFVRRPFTDERLTKRFKFFAYIKDHLRQTKASRVGKAKSFFQVMALVVAMPYHQDWLSPGVLPDIVLGIALPLGILSVITRINIHRDVDKVVDDVHSVFVAEEQS